jgi:prephenate dehydratase
MKIGFLGPEGTYSHQAAKSKFPTETLVPFDTIPLVLDALHQCDRVVIPFENSTFGLVQQTIDAFRELPESFLIYEQILLPIHHCILSKSKLSSVTKVYSHREVPLCSLGTRTVFRMDSETYSQCYCDTDGLYCSRRSIGSE